MTARYRTAALVCALLAPLAACSSPRRDLGDTGDGMPSAMSNSECDEAAASVEAEVERPRAAFLSDFEGLWLGQLEDALGEVDEHGALPVYTFPSGSRRILLEVSGAEEVTAKLTFGAQETHKAEPASRAGRRGVESALPPAEGVAYTAVPIASALDVERAGEDASEAELDAIGPGTHPQQPALDGKLVLAFAIEDRFAELHLRFGGDGLVGAFDGLPLINERGFETRPGRARFRRESE